tara:strand:+ start:17403 stop:19997 length:2595 start_codon:yes stop_codon:yes gene_type:complete
MTRAKDIFLDAMDREGPDREVFVKERCGEDTDLQNQVRRLLQASEASEAWFGDEGAPSTASAFLSRGTKIGPYTLEDPIGAGGFANVWRATQTEPVRRSVALKVLKAGMDTAEVVRRFEAEQQALAMMEHPGIAKVIDGGATAFGRPWFAMELVEGEPITDFCDRHAMDKVARLELFLEVCRAVQHAHQKGVIHRDLKPSNILVYLRDGKPAPKIIDFGIAKAVQRSLTEDSIRTLEGQVLGTPAYMSPEQVDESQDIDTRCDVYALGVLLYELLSGARPFEDDTLLSAGIAEVLRIIREVEPPRPSSRSSSTTHVLPRELRGDLDWIVMRCLEKDRERRYGSVSVLANEIERHLAGEPVLAGPPDLSYRARKFVARHQIGIAVGTAFVVLLVAGIIVTLLQMFRAQEAEQDLGEQVVRTQVELDKYTEISVFFEALLTGVDPAFAQGKDTELFEDLLDRAVVRVEDIQNDAPEVEATLRRAIGLAYLSLSKLEIAEVHLRRAMELRDAVLTDDDPDRYQVQQELAVMLAGAERFDESRELLEPALAGLIRCVGPDDARTLRVMNDLGVTYRRLKDPGRAEVLLRDALARRIATVGEADESTITVMNNLASTLEDQGHLDQAATLFTRALELQIEVQGVLHIDSMKALNNVGSILMDLGRNQEALPYIQKALELKREVLPDGHASLILSISNLGMLHVELDQLEAARGALEELMDMLDRTDTSSTPNGIKARFNFGRVLDDLDDLEGAATQYAECARLAEERFGRDFGFTVDMRGSHAWQLVKLERAEEAEPVLRTCLRWAENHASPEGPKLAVYRIRLGAALARMGQDDEAKALLERGLTDVRPMDLPQWVETAEQALADLDA